MLVKEKVLCTKKGNYWIDHHVNSDKADVYVLMSEEDGRPVTTPGGVAVCDFSLELMERVIKDIDRYRFEYREPALILTYVFTYVEIRQYNNDEWLLSTVDGLFDQFSKDDWADKLVYPAVADLEDRKTGWYQQNATIWRCATLITIFNAMRSVTIPYRLAEIDRDSSDKESDIRKLAKLAAEGSEIDDEDWFVQCFRTFLFAYNLDI